LGPCMGFRNPVKEGALLTGGGGGPLLRQRKKYKIY